MLGGIGNAIKRARRNRYTGPGSSPGTGGAPAPKPTPRYTGPGSSPGTGGAPKPSAKSILVELANGVSKAAKAGQAKSDSVSQYRNVFQ